MARRAWAGQAGGMDNIRASLARQGLVRSSDRGILGGVCAGASFLAALALVAAPKHAFSDAPSETVGR